MPARRVHQPDIRCPHCGDRWLPKAGTNRGRQTYLCRGCGRRFTVAPAYRRATPEQKAQARQMRRYGLGYRAIGSLLGVAPSTVLRWLAE